MSAMAALTDRCVRISSSYLKAVNRVFVLVIHGSLRGTYRIACIVTAAAIDFVGFLVRDGNYINMTVCAASLFMNRGVYDILVNIEGVYPAGRLSSSQVMFLMTDHALLKAAGFRGKKAQKDWAD